VDGLGRRVGKKIDGVLLKQWVYRDALKPVAELDGAGNLVAEFVYGAKSNVPNYVRRGTTTYRVISDQLGSPRYVVNVVNSTDVAVSATYTSFGDVTGTALDWMPFGFAGGIYDADSGALRFGARDYDPLVGRWTSKDPIRFASGRTNIYAYAGSDPVNRRDPSGLLDWDDACTIATTCQEECARLNAWDPLGYLGCLAGCVAGGLVWEERQPYGREKERGGEADCSSYAAKAYDWCIEDGFSPSDCAGVAAAAYADCMKKWGK
jgi:RHS repeat-associated protein